MKQALRYLLFAALAVGLYFAKPYVFPEKTLPVDVYRVTRGEVRETVTSPSSGMVVSAREALVASDAVGRVSAIVLDQGDRAAEGATVIVLDEREAAVDVRAAEAALATRRTAYSTAELRLAHAEDDLKSAEPLWQRKLMAEDQYRSWKTARDTAANDVEAARRAVAEADVGVDRSKVLLAKRRVTAPFAGVIRRKHVEVGTSVSMGVPLFEVFDDARLFVRAPLDEIDLPRVRPGMAVDVTLQPFGERAFRGTLRKIEPGVRTAKELNRTGEVEVDLIDVPGAPAVTAATVPAGAKSGTDMVAGTTTDESYPAGEGALRVGMSADIEVITRTRKSVLRVPSYAVHETDTERYVFRVLAGRIERRTVTVGYSNWDYAEITSGLAEGDLVVVSLDLKDLAPGKPASVAREIRKPEVE